MKNVRRYHSRNDELPLEFGALAGAMAVRCRTSGHSIKRNLRHCEIYLGAASTLLDRRRQKRCLLNSVGRKEKTACILAALLRDYLDIALMQGAFLFIKF